MEFYHKDSESIKSLIQLGVHGYFPLFNHNWTETDQMKSSKKLTSKEKTLAKKLFVKVAQHRGIHRKKTVLYSMSEDEQALFKRAFYKMVENKILDAKPGLQ